MTGSEIREIRQALGLTQEQLARELGVSFTTVSRWEQNHTQPSPLALEKLQMMKRQIGSQPPENMLSLATVLEYGGTDYDTLVEWTKDGLLPKARRVGSELFYPQVILWMIDEIKRLKGRAYGYTLPQIQDEIARIEEITPKQEISEPIQSDDLDTNLRIHARLDQEIPAGYEWLMVSYDRDEENGKLRVVQVWGRRKRHEKTKG